MKDLGATIAFMGNAYASYAAFDIEAIQASFVDDVVYHVPGRHPLSGDLLGRDAVLGYLASVAGISQGRGGFTVQHLMADGEHGVAIVEGTVHDGDRSFTRPIAHVFHVVEGRMVEFWELPFDQQDEDDFWSAACASTPTPVDVVTRLGKLLEVGDAAAYDLLAPDFVNHAAGPQGRDGFRMTMNVLANDLGELEAHQDRIVADGDLVVQELRLVGAHRASTMPLLEGIEPRGVQVSWTFVHTWRVADGLILEHWATRDDLGVLVQLGAWPPA